MSRITESLRRLIREEVQKSLRRKLLETDDDVKSKKADTDPMMTNKFEKLSSLPVEGDWWSGPNYDQYYDAEEDRTYIFGNAGIDINKCFYVDGDLRKQSFHDEDWEAVSKEDYKSVLDAMKVANEATPATPAAVDPAKENQAKSGSAKRRRESQPIVTQIQTALGMPIADVDGVWGDDTNDAWSDWLDEQVDNKKLYSSNSENLDKIKNDWKTGIATFPFNGGIFDDKDTPAQYDDDEKINFDGSPESMLKFINYVNNYKVKDIVQDFIKSFHSPANESRWLRLAGLLKG